MVSYWGGLFGLSIFIIVTSTAFNFFFFFFLKF
jgi:hypothetical protein